MKRIAIKIWTEVKRIGVGFIHFIEAFERDPGEQKNAEEIRAFAKWILEVVRNLAVVSAIKFFATRADSLALHVVAEIGMFAVAVAVATHLTAFRFTGWDEIEKPRLRRFLNWVYSVLPAMMIYAVMGKLINHVTGEIVRSQMMH